MLKIIDIHTYYGDSYVLQGISLEVPKGAVVALLGRNGVGKTTLVRSIVGFTSARRGQILFNGKDITHVPAYKIIRLQIGLVPQGRRIFPSLTVKENLAIASRGTGARAWDFEKVFSLFPRLKERDHHRGNELSGGEQQMLAIARALISNPVFLLMDEPTEGLAPVIVETMGRVIAALKERGYTIVLVEQNFHFAKGLADRHYVLEHGRIVKMIMNNELEANLDELHELLGV